MVQGRFKSGRFRRMQTKTATETKQRYKKQTPNQAHCGVCGKVLHGIPRGREKEISKLSKTEKRPERPYGGVLCSNCMREQLKVMINE